MIRGAPRGAPRPSRRLRPGRRAGPRAHDGVPRHAGPERLRRLADARTRRRPRAARAIPPRALRGAAGDRGRGRSASRRRRSASTGSPRRARTCFRAQRSTPGSPSTRPVRSRRCSRNTCWAGCSRRRSRDCSRSGARAARRAAIFSFPRSDVPSLVFASRRSPGGAQGKCRQLAEC